MILPSANKDLLPLNASRGWATRVARLFSSKMEPASVPEGIRVYAVGDVHGCAAELDRITTAIVRDSDAWKGERYLIYVGDYVDRGPDSKGVIDRLLNPPEGFIVHYLRGNHEQALLDFLSDPSVYLTWRDFGARETLMSYGVVPPRFETMAAIEVAHNRFRRALPDAHLAFFEGLELSISLGGYFFVHAGVRPGVALDRQSPEDLLWARDEFLLSSAEFGKVVVHGHTPTRSPVLRPNRIGIDTGAYATGTLTAAVLENTECRFLTS